MAFLEVKNLRKYYPVKKSFWGKTTSILKAVDDISFSVEKGEVLGLVGESGCGKTTTGKLVAGILQPTEGEIFYDGKNLAKLTREERRVIRKEIQFIFQDPYASLNPRLTIGQTIAEPIYINKIMPKEKIERRVDELLERVGMASYLKNRYPHEFSGGQRQRVGIARALALEPKALVCDEPVSALDVSIQAQVLNLLSDLKDDFGLTYIFIAHGLNVVEHLSDRIAVMYLGKIMEVAPAVDLYNDPKNPYTKVLMSAIPIPDPEIKKERILLTGDVPSPIDPPEGCRFASRCYAATDECKKEPEMTKLGGGREVACVLAQKNPPETPAGQNS